MNEGGEGRGRKHQAELEQHNASIKERIEVI